MKQNQTRFFAVLAAILIATLTLSACAPGATQATQSPTQAPTQAPAQPTAMPSMQSPTQAPAQPTSAPTEAQLPQTGQTGARPDPLAFQQAVRKLWEDHITWTRVYIIAAVAGLPEADAAAQRLLQNQVDIGNAIKPFYGDKAGEQLTALLKDHILIAVDLVTAAKSGDTAKFDAANQKWYDNANQIAAFLNSANPKNWPLSDVQSMMKMHLDLTLQEATARLKGDWTGDVAAYDKIHDEILQMADALSKGIVAQFPDKFAAQTATQKQVDLTLALDKLWEDHVTWTRMYIISATSGLKDGDAAAQRLLQNQVDIGNAIKPLYGDQAGEQLTALLKQHILTAVDLLSAAKSGDTAKFDAANKSWYDNANQIAAFLNGANPKNWPLSDLQSMMKMHLDLTLQEAIARLKGDWAGDVAAYDKVHAEILQMSGALSKGIVAQFPEQFK